MTSDGGASDASAPPGPDAALDAAQSARDSTAEASGSDAFVEGGQGQGCFASPLDGGASGPACEGASSALSGFPIANACPWLLVSSDGKRIVYGLCSNGVEIHGRTLASAADVVLVGADAGTGATPVSLTPDGSHLVVTDGVDLWAIATDGSSPRVTLASNVYQAPAVWFTGDSTTAAFVGATSGASAIVSARVDGSTPPVVLVTGSAAVQAQIFGMTPDGTTLVGVGPGSTGDCHIFRIDPKGASAPTDLGACSGPPNRQVVLVADSDLYDYDRMGTDLMAIRLSDGQARVVFHPTGSQALYPDLLANSALLMFDVQDGNLPDGGPALALWGAPFNGCAVQQIAPVGGNVGHFGPNRVVTDSLQGLYSVSWDGAGMTKLANYVLPNGPMSGTSWPVIAPDGSQVAFVQPDGLYEAPQTPPVAASRVVTSSGIGTVAFSGDSTKLYYTDNGGLEALGGALIDPSSAWQMWPVPCWSGVLYMNDVTSTMAGPGYGVLRASPP